NRAGGGVRTDGAGRGGAGGDTTRTSREPIRIFVAAASPRSGAGRAVGAGGQSNSGAGRRSRLAGGTLVAGGGAPFADASVSEPRCCDASGARAAGKVRVIAGASPVLSTAGPRTGAAMRDGAGGSRNRSTATGGATARGGMGR